jgi:hypothetical protein
MQHRVSVTFVINATEYSMALVQLKLEVLSAHGNAIQLIMRSLLEEQHGIHPVQI